MPEPDYDSIYQRARAAGFSHEEVMAGMEEEFGQVGQGGQAEPIEQPGVLTHGGVLFSPAEQSRHRESEARLREEAAHDIEGLIEKGALFKPARLPLSTFGSPELQEEAKRLQEAEATRQNLKARSLAAAKKLGEPGARTQLQGMIREATTKPPSQLVEGTKALGGGVIYGALQGAQAPSHWLWQAAKSTAEGSPNVLREAGEAFLGQRDVSPGEGREAVSKLLGLETPILPKEGALGAIGRGSADLLFGVLTDPAMLLNPAPAAKQFALTANQALEKSGAAKAALGTTTRLMSEYVGEPGGFVPLKRAVGKLAESKGGDAKVAVAEFERLAGPEGANLARTPLSIGGTPSTNVANLNVLVHGPERAAEMMRTRGAADVARRALAEQESTLHSDIAEIADAFKPFSPAERDAIMEQYIGPYVHGIAQAQTEPWVDPLQRGAAQMLHQHAEAQLPPDVQNAVNTFTRVLKRSYDRFIATGQAPGEAANIVSQRYDPRVLSAELERARPVGREAESVGMASSFLKPRTERLTEQLPAAREKEVARQLTEEPSLPGGPGIEATGITDPALRAAAALRGVGRQTAFANTENTLARLYGRTPEQLRSATTQAPAFADRVAQGAVERPGGLVTGRAEQAVEPRSLQAIDYSQFKKLKHPDTGEDVYVPAEQWNRADRLFSTFYSKSKLGRVLDKYLSLQRRSATMPIPVYHAQNVFSDLIDAARADIPATPYLRTMGILRGTTKPSEVVAVQRDTQHPISAGEILREGIEERLVQMGATGPAGMAEAPGSLRDVVRGAGVKLPLTAPEVFERAWTVPVLGKWGMRAAQAEANWVRLSAYLHYRTEGLSRASAVGAVGKLYPDMQDLSRGMQAAKYGFLFSTWQLKHAAISAEQFVTRPGRFTAMETARRAWNEQVGQEEGRLTPGQVSPSQLEQTPWRVPRAVTQGLTDLPVLARTRLPEQDVFSPMSRTGLPVGGVLGSLIPPAAAALGLATGRHPYTGAPIDEPVAFLLMTLGPLGYSRWARALGYTPEEFKTVPINEQWAQVRRLTSFIMPIGVEQVSPSQAVGERMRLGGTEELKRRLGQVRTEERRARLLHEPTRVPLTPRPQP